MISDFHSEIDQENAQIYFTQIALHIQHNITNRLLDSKFVTKYLV